MTSYASLEKIMNTLKDTYPDMRPLINYSTPFQLVIAVALSAQTSDAAVNKVTPELFARWPNPETLAAADPTEVEELIHPLGFFRQKTRNLISSAATLVERFGGKVPQSMADLTLLAGIGRKSANVIRSHVWNLPGIIVDTHFGRVCRRLGLTQAKDPVKLEFELADLIPEDRQREFSMTANYHGRNYCMSRKPDCGECPLKDICPKIGVKSNSA